MFIFCDSCVLCRWRPLLRADRSSRGVLQGVLVCLIVRYLEFSTMRRRRSDLCRWIIRNNVLLLLVALVAPKNQVICKLKVRQHRINNDNFSL